MTWYTLKVKDSTYQYAYDDGCIVLRSGKKKDAPAIWINPIILPKLQKISARLLVKMDLEKYGGKVKMLK